MQTIFLSISQHLRAHFCLQHLCLLPDFIYITQRNAKILGLFLSKDHCKFWHTFMLPLNPIRALFIPYNTINNGVLNKGNKNNILSLLHLLIPFQLNNYKCKIQTLISHGVSSELLINFHGIFIYVRIFIIPVSLGLTLSTSLLHSFHNY